MNPALAQTHDDQVKAANQAIIAAGLRGDQQAFATLVADELQWIRSTGEVLGKAEWLLLRHAATPLRP